MASKSLQSLLSLSNPLSTPEQLLKSSSQLDGISTDLESSIRFAGAQLTQAAGILLRLPQEIIAQSIVVFLRFYTGPEGGSFRINSAKVSFHHSVPVQADLADNEPLKDLSAASIYTIAKASALPQSPRSVVNVYAYLLSCWPPSPQPRLKTKVAPDTGSFYVSEGDYQSARTILMQLESVLLRSISFTTTVALPHQLALTYLQTLGVLPSRPSAASSALAKRTLAHLNTALFSPQLLYLTHQPATLAVASIYLAAREVGVSLATCEWWEVFDVDREELGFLVVGLRSCSGWIEKEKQKWMANRCPLTIEEIEIELRGEKILTSK